MIGLLSLSMLRFLSIKRLAVIDAAEVEFGPGLNVLTGETGAGKSILVEAVDLLLGGRASADLVRTGEETATIEAIFENGSEEVIVKRELTSQGRSRAFINGSLATAAALKDLSSRLVELHGQHEHHTLLDPGAHLAVLDTFGGFDAELAAVAKEFQLLHAATDELERVRGAAADRASRLELASFQLAELNKATLQPGEDEELASTRQVLASAERVERLCAESYASLYESDAAVLSGLGGVWRRVAELATLDPKFQPYLDARDGIKSQLEDLAAFLRRYGDSVDRSPLRLQQIEERLATLERLKRKYGPTLPDAIAKRDSLRTEVSELELGDERIRELEALHAASREQYVVAARALSSARRSAAPGFASGLEALLAELAMEQTRFEVRFADEPLSENVWSGQGFDRLEFFFSPNPGEDPRPLARVASGGELSRVMLAIKTMTFGQRIGSVATKRVRGAGAPGMIFDEVDAGIGGRTADVVGRKLRALGSAFQVLCITHLPQIAACADSHFHVEKRVEAGRTKTTIRRLDHTSRIDELGRMLAGAELTDAIRATAREMLEKRDALAPAPLGAKGESERAKGESPGRERVR
jgi:DNA repair protein RecN (Recombination protein N)